MRKQHFTYIFIIFLCFIIFNSNQTIRIANPYTSEPLDSSEFIICDGTNAAVVQKYKDNWEILPDYLRVNVESVIITNEKLNGKFGFSQDAKILAASYGSDIFINDSKFNPHVLIHELYHVYDYNHAWVSTRYEFQNMYKKYCQNQTNINIYEFFARTGEKYYFNPESLQDEAPELYNYFSSLR